MLLTDILTLERVKVPLTASTKRGLIEELVDLAAADGSVTDSEKALQAVLEREQTRTTGIGDALAIPHGKTAAVKELTMAIGRAPQGVDFESIDSKPVTLAILLLSPMDKTGPHIQALARISRLFSIESFRKKLNSAETARELLEIVQQQEQASP